MHKIGVWVDGRFSWLDDSIWKISITYQGDSMAGVTLASNPELGVNLVFRDCVYNEKDIFIREVTVSNLSDHPRLIKLYFHQQFEIYESHRKDTAFYDPHHHAIIHYKGRRVFLISASSESGPFDDYTTGLFGIENREGSYKDAEDGVLSKNPIEHGQVDSVLSVSLNIEPKTNRQVNYWITAGKLLSDAYDLNKYILEKTPSHLIKTSEDYWHAWANRQNFDFFDLGSDQIELFKKSLLIMRSHADNRGGIIASCDSDMLQYGRDNYSYVWPRDGAYCAVALSEAGDHEVARRFFSFCNSIVTKEGYFMHKYRPDESLGSSWHPWVRDGKPQLPIQEDETALVIYALWQYYTQTKDLEFIESIYNSLIRKSAEFMVAYRDIQTGLPLSSYDLWEQDYGTHTYTCCVVYSALNCAAKFADLLGKTESAKDYRSAADEIRQSAIKYLYDDENGYFYKSIDLNHPDRPINTKVDFSSVYGVFRFGLLETGDPKLTKAMSYSLFRLGLTTLVGGVARYEDDWYFRNDKSVPGNPWIITTLWLAQYYLTQAQKESDLASVKRLLAWVVKRATHSGILPEQLDPQTGAPLSAAPLTWSHSEFVTTVLEYLQKKSSFTH